MQYFSIDEKSFGSTETLWRETKFLPTQTIDTLLLENLLDTPYWDNSVSARNVILQPWWHVWHVWRILKADTNYPILLTWKEGFIVLDGMHRLTKLYLLGYRRIDVKLVDQEIIDRCFFLERKTSRQMADYIPLEDSEETQEPYVLTVRIDEPEEPFIEAYVNQLLGAVLRQIPKQQPSIPIFVLGPYANQVVQQSANMFDVWACAANHRGKYREWSLPGGFNRTLLFDLTECEKPKDLSEESLAWFKTIWCTLPEGLETQLSYRCKDLIIMSNVETPNAYDHFVGKPQLVENHIVICTSVRLRPNESVGYIIRTDELDAINV